MFCVKAAVLLIKVILQGHDMPRTLIQSVLARAPHVSGYASSVMFPRQRRRPCVVTRLESDRKCLCSGMLEKVEVRRDVRGILNA